jgi:hypothetical protein
MCVWKAKACHLGVLAVASFNGTLVHLLWRLSIQNATTNQGGLTEIKVTEMRDKH